MKLTRERSDSPESLLEEAGTYPGIVIADGGLGGRALLHGPRLRAFVYGEELPDSPTLPFGRWKRGS